MKTITEKLQLNKQSRVMADIKLPDKIKLALHFDDSVYKDIFCVYFECFQHIYSFVVDDLGEKDVNIYITNETWKNKLKENSKYENYKDIFIIDDKECKKLDNKYKDNLYYFTRGEFILATDSPLQGSWNKIMYFCDKSNANNIIECWFTGPNT